MLPVHERGFTLVEVLVALLVTSALMAIILDGAFGVRARSQNLATERDALHLADTELAERCADTAAPEMIEGKRGDLVWQFERREIAKDPRGKFVLIGCGISVGDQERPSLVSLSTRKLLPAQAEDTGTADE